MTGNKISDDLRTPEQRVHALKARYSPKAIERMYLYLNDIRVVKSNVLIDPWQKLPDGRTCAQCQLFQGCARNIQRHGDEDVCDYMPGRFKAKVAEVIECE